MSHTSIFKLNKNFYHNTHEKIHNGLIMSHFFQELYEKYFPEKLKTDPYFLNRLINEDPYLWDKRWDLINERIMKQTNFNDKIIWKLIHQNVFKTKDIEIINEALNWFSNYTSTNEGTKKRCNRLAESLINIDKEKYPYFIIKLTSVDNEVERWFENWNEDIDDIDSRSLSEFDEEVCLIISIDKEKEELDCMTNLDFFKEYKWDINNED